MIKATQYLRGTIILMFISTFLYGCSSLNKTTMSDFQVDYVKSKGRLLQKPHYIIKLKGDSVYYNGIANMPVLGERNFTISKDEFKTIKEAFELSNFSEFNELYQGNRRDLPMTLISYNTYEVRFQNNEAPEKLKKLALLMDNLLIKLKLDINKN